jgi:hypothetical protein
VFGVFSLACLLVVLAPTGTRIAQPEFKELSGIWTGTSSFVQDGDCDMDGGATSRAKARLFVEVVGEGRVHAGKLLKDEETRPSVLDWQGTLDVHGNVRITAPGRANCQGEWRHYSVELSGEFVRDSDKWQLRLIGIESTCPAMKCHFKREYLLTK